jgi:uncharacterized protein
MKNIINLAEQYFRDNIPPSWKNDSVYLKHVEDVAKYALDLAKEYGEDTNVAQIAAFLHDVGYNKSEDGKRHAGKSAEIAKELLSTSEIPEDIKEKIISAIAKHSMKDSVENEVVSVMDQIIRDADGISFMKNNIKYYYEYDIADKGVETAKRETLKKIDGMINKIRTKKGVELAQEFIDKWKEIVK